MTSTIRFVPLSMLWSAWPRITMWATVLAFPAGALLFLAVFDFAGWRSPLLLALATLVFGFACWAIVQLIEPLAAAVRGRVEVGPDGMSVLTLHEVAVRWTQVRRIEMVEPLDLIDENLGRIARWVYRQLVHRVTEAVGIADTTVASGLLLVGPVHLKDGTTFETTFQVHLGIGMPRFAGLVAEHADAAGVEIILPEARTLNDLAES